MAVSINNNWTQETDNTQRNQTTMKKSEQILHKFDTKDNSNLFHEITSTMNDNNKNINILEHEILFFQK